MEWLINRRRMMYNKAVPPTYVPFEDQAIWEYVCTYCGDYYETVIADNGNNTVNITKSYVSLLGTTIKGTIKGIEKKRIVVGTQTNVDNSSGTYVVGTTKEAIGITMKQMQALITEYIIEDISRGASGTLYHFEEFQYFTNINTKSPRRAASQKFEHIKFPANIVSLDFYTDWAYSPILDFPATLTGIGYYFWLRIRNGVTVIFRSATPPTIYDGSAASESNQKKIAHLYVPSAYVDTYKENVQFGYITDRIEAVEGTEYEVFNGWEYED